MTALDWIGRGTCCVIAAALSLWLLYGLLDEDNCIVGPGLMCAIEGDE